MRRKLKSIGLFFAVILLAVALSLVGLRSAWFKNQLREDLCKRLSSRFRGSIELGRIDAIHPNSVEVSNLVVILDADTVAVLPKLRVGFRPQGLLSKKISVTEIRADSLEFRLEPGDDGRLNVVTAVTAADPSTESGGEGGWTIDVADLVIRGGRAVIDLDRDGSRPPIRVSAFDLRGSFSRDPARLRAGVAEFRCTLQEPRVTVSRCSGVLEQKAGLWTLVDLVIETPANAIRGHGTWSVLDDSSRRFEFTTGLVEFSEFASLLGLQPVAAHPSIHVTGEFRKHALMFTLEAIENDAHLRLDGQVDKQDHTYNASGSMQGMVLDRWIPVTMPATLINGTFTVSGSDFGGSWRPANGGVALSQTTFDRFHVDSLNAAGSMMEDHLSASVRLAAEFGALSGTLVLRDLDGSRSFTTDASFRRVDPSKLSNRYPWEGRLNGRLHVAGSGLTIPAIEAVGTIDLADSKIGSVEFDSARAGLRYARQQLQVDRLWVSSPAGDVRMSGSYGNSAFAARGSVRLEDAAALPFAFGGEPLGGTGRIDLAVSGASDSIRGQAAFQIAAARVATITAGALTGRVSVSGAPKLATARVELQADSLRIGDLAIGSAGGAGAYDHDRVSGALSWEDDRIPSGAIEFDARLRPTWILSLPRIELDLGGVKWIGQSGPIEFDPSRREYAIHEVDLGSNGGRIRLSGSGQDHHLTQAEVIVTDLDLKMLAAAFDTSLALSGRVDGELRGSGNLNHPSVMGRFQVSDAAYRGSRGDLRIDGSYGDSRLESTVTLSDSAGSDLRLTLDLPLAAPGQGIRGALDPNGPMEISLGAQRHDIAWMSGLVGARTRGFLSSDLSVRGTLNQPQIHGAFTLDEGALESATLGFDVVGVTLHATGSGGQLLLDSLTMGSGTRRFRGHGAIALGKDIVAGSIDSLRLALDATQFQVLAGKKLDIAVDSHLDLEIHAKALTVNGNVDLVRTRIYLPAILGAAPPAKPADLPMLVLATAPLDTVLADTTAAMKRQSKYYRDALGKVRVTIPRGTWLYGPAMNVEISGVVEVIKTGPEVELFGVVEVKRGSYTVLGKSFQIEAGEIEFKGGPKVDPVLRLTLLHDFRTPTREKKQLRLDIGGEVSNPDLRFMFEDREISQADALSYILFGQSKDELTVSQQSSLGGNENQFGKNLAADALAAQMSSALASGVGMDVVELKGDENWSKASLTAGMYVGDDLYISYEQGFGDYNSNETAPRFFTVEYELIRALSLQLISGNEQSSSIGLVFIIE